MKVSLVIPAWNEEEAIGEMVRAVPHALVREIIVVDNASTDRTAERAAAAGARVVLESRRGYGAACLAGARAARNSEVTVFMDGDGSDDPGQLEAVAGPVIRDQADLVIGSRLGGDLEKGAMPWHQRLGNRIVVLLLRLLYRARITDLGSFRAIRTRSLHDLGMEQLSYGWPVEMVVKASRQGLRIRSVPVRYRRRKGVSKVTGTLKGSILAAYFMFFVPLRYLWRD